MVILISFINEPRYINHARNGMNINYSVRGRNSQPIRLMPDVLNGKQAFAE